MPSGGPPPVPPSAKLSDPAPAANVTRVANDSDMMASDRWQNEERKSQFSNTRYDSMSDVKLAEDMIPERAYTDHGTSVLSTGNPLEDLDNLLRIYRNLAQNDGV